MLPGEDPATYVERLAQSKAEALWDQLAPEERLPVLGADTTVALGSGVEVAVGNTMSMGPIAVPRGAPQDMQAAAEITADLQNRISHSLNAQIRLLAAGGMVAGVIALALG